MKQVQRARGSQRTAGAVAQRTGSAGAKLQQYDVEVVVEALKPVWARFQRVQRETRVSPVLRRIPHTV